ncbi:sensor histidine kinase N-terminal domain-containing protein [Halomonas elongata]|uniref:histidine kinase n=1 Tax=Halomonas elongata (strain ATCC 33173 / DSM 2581 / NBRC 15536 / NCIMB 2198 / 1H9) TaxID=768066 RepID=E1VB88_HALED|nr:sensor histidine kinase N-terminal domain-containing protein [Halomonas elongata]WBF19418.1 sensor histidine kinase N-terminal domain-containing protein [Halomonas elongata]WPU48279.1 sensor histidine kinase N-terminal domain-containing protein [Halomonas elongata DSM 2581]CBV42149.1 sensor histidine kinase [Halomonas elongata DSM 2581]
MITRDSLYRRLLTWLLLPMVALGGLMLFQAWIDARQTADRAFDRLLEAATLAIAEQVQWQDDRLWLDLPPAALEMLATDAEERVFYAIYDNRGRFVTGNAELPGASDEAIAADGGLHYRDIQWHGMALREGIRRTRLEDWRQRERFDVRVAHTREGRERLASQLLRGNLAYILGMALLAAATLVIAIRTALAPLTRLRRAIRARDPRTLAPLELPLPRELAELRETLNELLARMRRVRANQERFIGDASHQLRTPLAGLSARAELALRQDDPAQWRQALIAMQETSTRTSRLAMQLLSLTRLDNPEYRPELAPVALDEIARRAVKQHWSACHRDGIDLGVEAPQNTVEVQGLDWQLEEALGNLIDNARRYGARRITVRITEAPPVLEVEDDGPGIPEAKRLLMLRPFHRGSDDPDGSGLGLAIVDGIARTHGARLGLADGHDGQGLKVTLSFPGDSP